MNLTIVPHYIQKGELEMEYMEYVANTWDNNDFTLCLSDLSKQYKRACKNAHSGVLVI